MYSIHNIITSVLFFKGPAVLLPQFNIMFLHRIIFEAGIHSEMFKILDKKTI